MKVIVTCRNYHGMEMGETPPEVYLVKDNETPEEVLRNIWAENYEGAITDNINCFGNDPIDEENCWVNDNMALITWKDGDTKEFHIVDVWQ
jgi:hypothetical protein